jgi:serine/threonine protein phosphatase PrpC
MEGIFYGKIMSRNWVLSSVVASSKSNGGDDLIRIKSFSDEFKVFLLADGATGTGNGGKAAQVLSGFFNQYLLSCQNFEDVALKINEILIDADKEIKRRNINGDTAAIILAVEKNRYAISSVGDSEAWMIKNGSFSRLTYNQYRKPRVGSGARLNSVEYGEIDGQIILFSDGLRHAIPDFNDWFKYKNSPEEWADLLLNDALYKWNNELPDDISIITATLR